MNPDSTAGASDNRKDYNSDSDFLEFLYSAANKQEVQISTVDMPQAEMDYISNSIKSQEYSGSKNLMNGHSALIEELANKGEKLKHENKDLLEKNIVLESQIANYEDRLSKKMSDVLNKTMENDTLKLQCEINEKEKDDLKSKVAELQAEVYQHRQLGIKKDSEDRSINELQKDLNSRVRIEQKLRGDIESCNLMLTEKSNNLKKIKKVNTKLWNLVQRLGNKLSKANLLTDKEKSCIVKKYDEEHLVPDDLFDFEDKEDGVLTQMPSTSQSNGRFQNETANSITSPFLPPLPYKPGTKDGFKFGQNNKTVSNFQSGRQRLSHGSNYFLKSYRDVLDDPHVSDDCLDVSVNELTEMRQQVCLSNDYTPISPLPPTPPPKMNQLTHNQLRHVMSMNNTEMRNVRPIKSYPQVSKAHYGSEDKTPFDQLLTIQTPSTSSTKRLNFVHQQSEGFEVPSDSPNKNEGADSDDSQNAILNFDSSANISEKPKYKVLAKRRHNGCVKVKFNLPKVVLLEVDCNSFDVSCTFPPPLNGHFGMESDTTSASCMNDPPQSTSTPLQPKISASQSNTVEVTKETEAIPNKKPKLSMERQNSGLPIPCSNDVGISSFMSVNASNSPQRLRFNLDESKNVGLHNQNSSATLPFEREKLFDCVQTKSDGCTEYKASTDVQNVENGMELCEDKSEDKISVVSSSCENLSPTKIRTSRLIEEKSPLKPLNTVPKNNSSNTKLSDMNYNGIASVKDTVNVHVEEYNSHELENSNIEIDKKYSGYSTSESDQSKKVTHDYESAEDNHEMLPLNTTKGKLKKKRKKSPSKVCGKSSYLGHARGRTLQSRALTGKDNVSKSSESDTEINHTVNENLANNQNGGIFDISITREGKASFSESSIFKKPKKVFKIRKSRAVSPVSSESSLDLEDKRDVTIQKESKLINGTKPSFVKTEINSREFPKHIQSRDAESVECLDGLKELTSKDKKRLSTRRARNSKTSVLHSGLATKYLDSDEVDSRNDADDYKSIYKRGRKKIEVVKQKNAHEKDESEKLAELSTKAKQWTSRIKVKLEKSENSMKNSAISQTELFTADSNGNNLISFPPGLDVLRIQSAPLPKTEDISLALNIKSENIKGKRKVVFKKEPYCDESNLLNYDRDQSTNLSRTQSKKMDVLDFTDSSKTNLRLESISNKRIKKEIQPNIPCDKNVELEPVKNYTNKSSFAENENLSFIPSDCYFTPVKNDLSGTVKPFNDSSVDAKGTTPKKEACESNSLIQNGMLESDMIDFTKIDICPFDPDTFVTPSFFDTPFKDDFEMDLLDSTRSEKFKKENICSSNEKSNESDLCMDEKTDQREINLPKTEKEFHPSTVKPNEDDLFVNEKTDERGINLPKTEKGFLPSTVKPNEDDLFMNEKTDERGMNLPKTEKGFLPSTVKSNEDDLFVNEKIDEKGMNLLKTEQGFLPSNCKPNEDDLFVNEKTDKQKSEVLDPNKFIPKSVIDVPYEKVILSQVPQNITLTTSSASCNDTTPKPTFVACTDSPCLPDGKESSALFDSDLDAVKHIEKLNPPILDKSTDRKTAVTNLQVEVDIEVKTDISSTEGVRKIHRTRARSVRAEDTTETKSVGEEAEKSKKKTKKDTDTKKDSSVTKQTASVVNCCVGNDDSKISEIESDNEHELLIAEDFPESEQHHTAVPESADPEEASVVSSEHFTSKKNTNKQPGRKKRKPLTMQRSRKKLPYKNNEVSELASINTVFQSLEKMKFTDQHFNLHLHSLVNVFANPANSQKIIIFHLVNYLHLTRKNPMLVYSSSHDPSMLLPQTENCIVTALMQIDRKRKFHLQGLPDSIVKTLYHLVLGKEQFTIYGLCSLCRVMTEICKQKSNSKEPILLCCDLLKLQHKYAPYLIASIAGVWKELFQLSSNSDEEKVFLSTIAYAISKKPKTLTDTQWKHCSKVLSEYLTVQLAADIPHTVNFLEDKIRLKCFNHSYDEEYMLTTPLIVFARLKGWDWAKDAIVESFIKPSLNKFSGEELNENAFSFFCNLYGELCLDDPEKKNPDPLLMHYFRIGDKDGDFVQCAAAVTLLKVNFLKKILFPPEMNTWMKEKHDDPRVLKISALFYRRMMPEQEFSLQEIDSLLD